VIGSSGWRNRADSACAATRACSSSPSAAGAAITHCAFDASQVPEGGAGGGVGASGPRLAPFMELGCTDESTDVGDVGPSSVPSQAIAKPLARNKPITRSVRECISLLLEQMFRLGAVRPCSKLRA
jgi:hypothetical protein